MDRDARGDSPKRAGVGGALDSLDHDVAKSLKLSEELEMKLSGILRQGTSEVAAEGSMPPTRDISSVTSEVEGINNRVRGLNGRLNDLLVRLDL